MATWSQAVPPPWKRMARRSTDSLGSSEGAPWTWLRKPSSAYLSARVIPDFASRRLASTSCVVLPMDETMPIPVTTTRLMPASSASSWRSRGLRFAEHARAPAGPLRAARRDRGALAEQSDLEIARPVDPLPSRREPAVGDAEHQDRAHHALDVDAVHDLLDGGKNLAGELHLAHAERTPVAGRSEPAQKEADELPQGVEAETARHHGVALEVAGEEPQVRLHVELGARHSLAVLAALLGNLGDPVEHQHRRQRKLWSLGEHLAAAAGQELIIVEARWPIAHSKSVLAAPWLPNRPMGRFPNTHLTRGAKPAPDLRRLDAASRPAGVCVACRSELSWAELQLALRMDIITFETI